jgi:hypothetical protein
MIPLGLGVSVRWAAAGPADFTPLLAMLAAVLVARFVIRLRLTVMSTVVAAGIGAAWAAALELWGFSAPTLMVILLVAILRFRTDRMESA